MREREGENENFGVGCFEPRSSRAPIISYGIHSLVGDRAQTIIENLLIVGHM